MKRMKGNNENNKKKMKMFSSIVGIKSIVKQTDGSDKCIEG